MIPKNMQLTLCEIRELEKVKQIIELKVHQHIRIKDLLTDCTMCQSKLAKGFRFLYQTSIFQYHLNISMEYAVALLEEGEQVKKIAYHLGYKTPGHFTRAFMKVFSRPPSYYKMNDERRNNAVDKTVSGN